MDFDQLFGDEAATPEDLEAQEVAPEGTDNDGGSQDEVDAKLHELAMEQLAELKEELAEKYPAAAPLLDLVSAPTPEALEQMAYELNARLGGEVVEDHPGADSEARRIQAMAGDDVLAKSLSYAKATGRTGAYMALRRAAAYEQAGLSGSRLDAEQKADIRSALRFAKAAQDHAAIQRLMAQLG